MHRRPRETCRQDAGADVVAAVGGAADVRQLAAEPRPVGGHGEPPDVVGVPGEAPTDRRELAGVVAEDGASDELQRRLSGQGQPADRVGITVERQPVPDRANPTGDATSARWRTVGSHVVAKRAGCSRRRRGQVPLHHGVHALDVRVIDQHGRPQAPVVVAGGVVIEAEHVGAGTQTRDGHAELRQLAGQQRLDHLGGVVARQDEAGGRHVLHRGDATHGSADAGCTWPAVSLEAGGRVGGCGDGAGKSVPRTRRLGGGQPGSNSFLAMVTALMAVGQPA